MLKKVKNILVLLKVILLKVLYTIFWMHKMLHIIILK